jgi:hypothetical protein
MVSQCNVPADRLPRSAAIDTFLASRTLRFAIVGESNFGYLRYMDAGGKISIRPNPPSEVPEAALLFCTRQDADDYHAISLRGEVVVVYLDATDPRLSRPTIMPSAPQAKAWTPADDETRAAIVREATEESRAEAAATPAPTGNPCEGKWAYYNERRRRITAGTWQPRRRARHEVKIPSLTKGKFWTLPKAER